MRLTFLGTRGEIRVASREHRRHSALLVEAEDVRVLIDAGADWLGELEALRPSAVLVTHAHPDHAGGLARGAPCPVFATAVTHDLLGRYPLERVVLAPRERRHLGPLTFSAHQATHSLRAPAVGFRLEHGRQRAFYIPDVLELVDPRGALAGVGLYIGDGATFGRPIVRHRDGEAFGHATIESQLDRCAEQRVPEAVFTHCGSRIVKASPERVEAHVADLGRARGVTARVAHDGDVLGDPGQRSGWRLSHQYV